MARAGDVKDCTAADNAVAALRACTSALEIAGISDQDRVQILNRRAAAWSIEEEPAEAVADFSRALAIDKANSPALAGRARAYAALGDHKRAGEDWTALIAESAEGAEKEKLLLARAESRHLAGDGEAALADYDAILAGNAKSTAAQIGRARVFAARDDRGKALEAFASAIAIDPLDTGPYIARAEAAERWGDTTMAIEDYKFVVKNNSRSAGPYRQALKRLGVDTPP